jgi:hypothetical protein
MTDRAVFVLCWTALAAGALGAGEITPHGTQPPILQPIQDPSGCEGCHGHYDGAANIEPWNTWAGSMMAQAARDPIFWAALDVANHDVPGVGELCLRCHAPKAWLEGRASGADGDGCGLVGELDQPGAAGGNDFSGAACHFCHRMMINPAPPPGEEGYYTENAEYWIDDAGCTTSGGSGNEPCRRGPYDYPGNPDPPHEWAFSPYHQSADFCGNCHNVTSPTETLIDENGVNTAIPYPIERTHREWVLSELSDPASPTYARCQACHMPDAPGPGARACSQNSFPDRSGDMPIHQFVGGNAWIPDVLRLQYPTTLGAAREDELLATAAWAREMLQSLAAAIEVGLPPSVTPGGTLEAQVKVTNLAGHKLPTGYPEGRRMWLHVVATDENETVIFQSGAYDPATGDLEADPQLKIYETVRGVWNGTTQECEHTGPLGAPVFHFVLNNCITLDNRIPPLGFTGGDDPEVRPVGYSYPETSPGSGVLVNHDVTVYAIPVPPQAAGEITVTATLRYQTSSKEYIEFLHAEAVAHGFPDDCIPRAGGTMIGTSRGEHLYELWQSYGRSPPVDMVTIDGSTVVQEEIFADGFESGDTSAWNTSVGG